MSDKMPHLVNIS